MLQAARARPDEVMLAFQRTTKVHWDPGASPAGKGMRARPHAGHCGRGRRSPIESPMAPEVAERRPAGPVGPRLKINFLGCARSARTAAGLP